ncbi:4578_t:CDS:1, partial [Gigaspora rosea]
LDPWADPVSIQITPQDLQLQVDRDKQYGTYLEQQSNSTSESAPKSLMELPRDGTKPPSPTKINQPRQLYSRVVSPSKVIQSRSARGNDWCNGVLKTRAKRRHKDFDQAL